MKVVINACYGGFSLSTAAMVRIAEIKGIKLYPEKSKKFSFMNYWLVPPEQRPREIETEEWLQMSYEEKRAHNEAVIKVEMDNRNIPRNDPALIQAVEELGTKANGDCARLKVVEIPDGIDWEIEAYDGLEHVAEKHRSWS